MNILVVSNLYPPHHIGGYELGCRDIVEKLRARGHDVRVLTSTFRTNNQTVETEGGIERVLQFTTGAAPQRAGQFSECRLLGRTLEEFRPGVVYFFNQAGLSRWLPMYARLIGYPMAFFLSDTTFVSWRIGAWLAGPAAKHFPVRVLFGKTFMVKGWPVIWQAPCHFASEFLRRVAVGSGIRISEGNSIIAHWGIDRSQFPAVSHAARPLRRLLYAGQLIPQKGVHTAMAAVELLVKEKTFSECRLTIAGGGMNPEYEKKLREQAARPGLAGRVEFLGRVARTDLPRIYAEHDALIFPSEWDEPFAITPLEAMAGGLPVIGTLTGGSGELFRNRETAMTYQAGDAADCARAMRELAADDGLRAQMTKTAQETVFKKHTMDVMVDGIEKSLDRIAGNWMQNEAWFPGG